MEYSILNINLTFICIYEKIYELQLFLAIINIIIIIIK